ncbi:host specificity factor TipJ family phage tail protein (plasmid) [Vibrio alginolyticus]|uniref:host specificity factor TipJ family phage tail protein n=1 Tax=Vibrio alginolyticus TaxID=663 RepID=UPI001C3C9FDA|nr:host specificity factor TipJ family phage tail protein [Vibrio alginolyticus]URR30166.1 host specificity factor TipJ family phage tail protein [Vibrio alginolyticus]
MPHIIEFKHPIKRDDYRVHTVPVGTNLADWLATHKPASTNLQATLNFSRLDDMDVTLNEFDAISIRPKLGFGVDWVIWAALAVSAASAIYSYSQMPDTSGNKDTQQASSVYNYNGQGNKPKLGNPVPVQFGRMPHYPDIIAPNWWVYDNNEQYYFQTFSKGVGKFQIHEHYIGETPLSQFGDIEVRVYQPGQVVDHFPHIVWTSKEVGGADGQGGLTLDGVTSGWVAAATSNEARFRGKVVELWSQYSIHTGNGDYSSTWRRDKWPWEAGQHVVITSTTQESLVFEGNIHFHDMGDDGDVIDPEELPDEIENPLGWGSLAHNDRIVITGAGVNSGTFIVTAFRPGNRIRVKTDGGSEVTSFEPMSNVYVRIFEAVGNDGTYVCKDNNGTLALVASDTLEEVVGWSGFSSIDSPTADISVLERDREAEWVGNFLCVPSDATALDVGLDFIFPRGLGALNKNGDINARTCEWQVRARPAGTNDAYQYHKLLLTKGDNTPQRLTVWLSEEMGLEPGRWEVGCRRISTVTNSTKVFDEIQWMGLKSIIQHDYVNESETIITLKIKATNSLSQQANQQYWNDSTRILPVRQSDGQYAELPTRSIAHAVIDACRNSVYGAALTDDAIDLSTFEAYHAKWEERGDRCDGLFDQPTAFWAAIETLLLAGRSYPRIDFGTVSMWRDEPRSVLCKPYSPVNMEPDSFSADISHIEDGDFDGIELEWFNPQSRKSETYVATVSNQPGYNPKQLKMPFITSLEHAKREALFHAAVQAYRRTNINFSTDIDGWESNYGDMVPVAHDALEWGASGQVIEKMKGEDGNHYLQLSGLLKWEEGKPHYILFNLDNSGVHGPYRVEPTTAKDIVILVDEPKHPIYEVGENGKKPSEYMFGQANRMYKKCILMQVQQKGEFSVGCAAVEDDPRVEAYA